MRDPIKAKVIDILESEGRKPGEFVGNGGTQWTVPDEAAGALAGALYSYLVDNGEKLRNGDEKDKDAYHNLNIFYQKARQVGRYQGF